jgi:hypothetical protein
MILDSQGILRKHIESIWPNRKIIESLIESTDFKVPTLQQQKMIFSTAELKINDSKFKISGPDRLPDWEAGWNEVLSKFNQNPILESLIPQYFTKHQYSRLDSRFVLTAGTDTELKFLRIIQTLVLSEILNSKNGLKDEISSIYEFGCGTGHNLAYLSSLWPKLMYFGLDWSTKSQQLLKEISEVGLVQNLDYANFDFFAPNADFKLKSNSLVLTVATLEQVGSEHTAFIDYLLTQQPKIVVHIEPEQDLLDANNPVDQLSIRYAKNRGYLNGLLSYLKILENQSLLKIHSAYRTGMGSYLLDGYSVIIWEPIK